MNVIKLSVLALALVIIAACSSGSGGSGGGAEDSGAPAAEAAPEMDSAPPPPSLVGEWSNTMYNYYFNADGTCGYFYISGGTNVCDTDCTWTLIDSGKVLTWIWKTDAAPGGECSYTLAFQSDTDLVLTPYAGQCTYSEQWTRVNSSSTNQCP